MITVHENAGSRPMAVRLTKEDRAEKYQDLEILGHNVENVQAQVNELADQLAIAKKELAQAQGEVFSVLRILAKGEEERPVIFDELHDHDTTPVADDGRSS